MKCIRFSPFEIKVMIILNLKIIKQGSKEKQIFNFLKGEIQYERGCNSKKRIQSSIMMWVIFEELRAKRE